MQILKNEVLHALEDFTKIQLPSTLTYDAKSVREALEMLPYEPHVRAFLQAVPSRIDVVDLGYKERCANSGFNFYTLKQDGYHHEVRNASGVTIQETVTPDRAQRIATYLASQRPEIRFEDIYRTFNSSLLEKVASAPQRLEQHRKFVERMEQARLERELTPSV